VFSLIVKYILFTLEENALHRSGLPTDSVIFFGVSIKVSFSLGLKIKKI
jgi:hypothetical protein